MPSLSAGSAPPGFLRLLVVFHESRGARRRALRPAGARSSRRVRVDAERVVPGRRAACSRRPPPRFRPGRIGESRSATACAVGAPSPASSARLRETPGYLRAFRQMLLQRPAARRTREHAAGRFRRRESHGSSGFRSSSTCTSSLRPAPKRTLTLRAAAKTADVLVVVSEAVARVVRPHAGDTPVLVAHNGVAAATSDAPAGSRRRRSARSEPCAAPRAPTSSSRLPRSRDEQPPRAPLRAHRPDRSRRGRRVRAAISRRSPGAVTCSAAVRPTKGSIAGSSSCSPPARTLSRSRRSRRWLRESP